MKLFKKIFLLLTLTTIVISCSDDNPHVITNSEKIAATWELTKFDSDGSITITAAGEDTVSKIEMIGKTFNHPELNFGNNPNNLTSSGSFVLVTTTTNSLGDEETKEEITDFSNQSNSGSWLVKDNTLTVTVNGEEQVYTITELTDHVLKLKRDTEIVTDVLNIVTKIELSTKMELSK